MSFPVVIYYDLLSNTRVCNVLGKIIKTINETLRLTFSTHHILNNFNIVQYRWN